MTLTIDMNKLAQDGYVVVDGLLDETQLAAFRHEAAAMGEQQPERWGWNEYSCFRRPEFRRLLACKPLIDLARRLVGDDLQLLQFDLLRVHAAGGEEFWHRDVERVFDEMVSLSCAIYLQDTPREAGALLVVPGSHRWKAAPSAGCDGFRDKAVSIPVKAGSAIIHDSGLWHSASPNAAAADCWALFPIFGPYWIKRRGQHTSRLPADLLQTNDPLVKQLLGLAVQPGTPTYLGDSETYDRRGDEGIDFVSR